MDFFQDVAKRWLAVKIISGVVILYIIFREILGASLGEYPVDIVLGGWNSVLLTIGLLAAGASAYISRNGIMIGYVRMTREEYPQTYHFVVYTLFFVALCCFGGAVYTGLDRAGLWDDFCRWLSGAPVSIRDWIIMKIQTAR